MKICLLTYDIAHRKTVEVFLGFQNAGRYELSFLAVPFSRRPERNVLFKHRSDQFAGVSSRDLAAGYNLPFRNFEEREAVLAENDYLIVCGANILEPAFANSGKIINGHAGLIPHVRGLDSFKWAILNDRIIGNTLHFIDERADFGKVLHHLPTPLFQTDTIADFAMRHYNNEIWLLTNFESFLTDGSILELSENTATKRMSRDLEKDMLAQFDTYKAKHAVA